MTDGRVPRLRAASGAGAAAHAYARRYLRGGVVHRCLVRRGAAFRGDMALPEPRVEWERAIGGQCDALAEQLRALQRQVLAAEGSGGGGGVAGWPPA